MELIFVLLVLLNQQRSSNHRFNQLFFFFYAIAKILIIIFFPIADLALKMARGRNALAFARDVNKETALHLLAQNQMPLDSCCHCPEHDHHPITTNPGKSFH